MKKMKIVIFLVISIILAGAAVGEAIPDYYSRYFYLMAPPGAFQYGLDGYVNPANLAFLKAGESRFFWSTEGVKARSFENWGFVTAVPSLGFGMEHQRLPVGHVNDYRISLAGGNDGGAIGMAYGWSSGDYAAPRRERLLSIGGISRPNRYLSLGLLGNFSVQSPGREGVAEIGIRPLGDARLTLFADGAWMRGNKFKDSPWSAGAAVELSPGIGIVGRYFDSKAFTLGLSIDFGHLGISGQGHYDNNQKLSGYTYSVRAGGLQPSIFNTLGEKDNKFVPISLKGLVEYQKYALFDDQSLRFMDILKNIRAAVDDPRIGIIALNLSGLRIYPENAWEIREELKRAQTAGKKVVIFFDNAGMTGYYLASAADLVVMDPQGSLTLYGYAISKTYFRGTLDKLGLGFDEWRFFKYKSAVEVLSRDKMSEADSAQNQVYVDDWYESTRADICQSRGLSADSFDSLINNQAYFMPDMAVKAGLVDTLARWSDIERILWNETGNYFGAVSTEALLPNALPPVHWGLRPQIAVVYGLGDCAMDTGIKARRLEQVFLGLAGNRNVKAVVFRVDSPGGDGMASDIVAEALKRCAQEKPVIVSQGQVAGSGGYWISMYGTQILAGPSTITGSIGVIGGWLYDKGLAQKLGMTSDHVKRGKHADLGLGVILPFVGYQVPARDLTQEEYAKMEGFIKEYYDGFVGKVAEGRKLSIDSVRSIAEGHFYSGIEGKKLGLVDEIGGLENAIDLAKSEAGIAPDEEIDIIEISKYKGLFNFPWRIPSLPTGVQNNSVYNYLKKVCEQPGQPLPMMLPGTYPEISR
ncbi:putative Periplasmic serine protease [Candidatus Zixiibacteriota bacterium]|nr:putative Periplasmic serine protease [candidate division Zixibacteria bacterium]